MTSIIIEARKITRYDRTHLCPQVVEMEVKDDAGRTFQLTGEVVAGAPLNTWPKIRVPTCLAKWSCNGRTGWGDIQEAQWHDFLKACL